MEKSQNKELAIIQKNVSSASGAAQALIIKDQKGLEKAIDVLSKIKSIGKQIKERMEAPVKRAYQAYKDIKAEQEKTFGAMLSSYEEAEQIAKGKILDYQQEVDRAAREAEEKLAARVERGTMRPETASKKMEDIERVDTTVQSKGGAVQFRTVQRFEIIDKAKLPMEYLTPDLPAIRGALFQGIKLEGVRYYEEKILAGSSK